MRTSTILLNVAFLFCQITELSAQTKTEVIPYTKNVVRVVKTTNGSKITPDQKQSLSVIINADKKAQMNFTWTIDSKGNVTFSDKKGKVLLKESESAFTPIQNGPDKGSFKVKQGFALDPDEPIYGLGLLQNGKMSQRGENRLMIQSNLEDYSNFFQSIKGYGLFWDNYSPTQITDANNNLSLESQVGDIIDYYFMYGGNADGVIAEMRALTGKVPMLPLWTYGFHQSRERYKSQKELLEVVHKYRDTKVPFDGIIQDWQYWGSNYTWNAMEFLNDEFPQAQQMIDEVHRQNAHMSISIWASFGPETKGFKELKSKGLLFDFETWPQSGLPQWPPRMDYPSGVRCYDCFSKEARNIYWKNLSNLHKMGIDAWWMDSTDPDHHSFKESDLDQVVPMTMPDGTSKMVSYRSVRNAFPLMTVNGVYEGQRSVDSTKRVFILTRSYFAGQQRTGANTWSGDVNSSWEMLRKQVPICLNYTLTANPNVNTDLGGFFANSYNTVYGDNSATRNPQYQELYTRWMQFGTFCPMMRSHGTEVYREIYYFGKEGETVYDALKDAIKMRYKILPYIYSTSWQVSKYDDSFMRALMMDFPEDKNVWDNNKQFMFGRSFLVCPIVDPLFTQEKIIKTDAMTGWNRQNNKQSTSKVNWDEKKTYKVYLPKGETWYDFHSDKKYEGGQTIDADAPISYCPVFVKAGSIIPFGPDVQYSNEKPWDNLEIKVYPGKDATFTLYEDEGDNYNYEKGEYTTIRMDWNEKSKTLTIGKREGQYKGMLNERKFTVNGKEISYKGKPIKVKL